VQTTNREIDLLTPYFFSLIQKKYEKRMLKLHENDEMIQCTYTLGPSVQSIMKRKEKQKEASWLQQ
jgi:hypothetical protein